MLAVPAPIGPEIRKQVSDCRARAACRRSGGSRELVPDGNAMAVVVRVGAASRGQVSCRRVLQEGGARGPIDASTARR